jgi:hypothetical protein
MHTVIVQFDLPEPLTLARARELFLGSAPKYRDLPGLLRKYYVLSEDGRTAGGVYLWRSRADAERFYDDAWTRFVTGRYGAPPRLAHMASPVVVDNVAGGIVTDAPA